MVRRPHAAALAIALAAAPFALSAPASAAEPSSVTLVGSLQDELGCAADWDPACAKAHLVQDASGQTWSATISLPAGSYEYKVAIDDGWAENYGAGGVKDGSNVPLVLEGPARLRVSYDETSHVTTMTPLGLAGATSSADKKAAADSLRGPLGRERFYFVMADRFANGSTANDRGGLTGGRLTTGYDPSDKAFYHGGDLKGLTGKLDYIKGMGTTAIWLTPSFKNKPVQGKAGEESAGYHGYWITDFTQIDPHLGTNAEMKTLIDAAHKKGMKVFFDIITNHTADVIDYEEGAYTYKSKKSSPYTDTSGTAFDDRDFVGKPASQWPAMDRTSFPYTPFVRPAEKDVKVPAWLNDPLMYHNRGDSTFAGESSTYGDFIGLDDLFTERPEVVEGMGEIYKQWADFGIDGFRIDTVKHVNLEFWQQFMPDLLTHAQKKNDDFFAFGEVYDGNPAVMSEYTTRGKLQATLDFGFQQQGVDFAKGKSAATLADFFAKDDWYTDADSNAYQLPTFLGNHDMGRASMFLKDSSTDEKQHLARVRLAQSLMFTTRGNPVTYYGDEQGFIGTGGDQLARQDMFASKTSIYNAEDVLAGPEGSRDRYSRTHPLYRHVAELSRMRAKHPALADGAQVARYASDDAGIFAVSRLDASKKVEYVVAANNSTTTQTASFATWTKGSARAGKGRYDGALFTPVTPGAPSVRPGADGRVSVTVPPLSVRVWKANRTISTGTAAPTVELSAGTDHAVGGRAEISADVTSGTFAQATVLYRPVGTKTWRTVGTDDNAPYRVFHDVEGMALGTMLEYRVVVEDAAGRVSADSDWASVVSATGPAPEAEIGDPPATQPGAVAVAGTHNSEMGCAADWEPWCDQAQLTLDPQDSIWKGSYTLPAGPYAFKAALDRTWTENYGEKGERDGANISYETDGPVSFYYDPTTHWATTSEDGPVVTAPGDYQSELGCGADWSPACMRPWLQDKDGDGTYTWATTKIPAGTWSFKIAHDLSWTTSYGAGGSPTGGNITVTVPADGAKTVFSYDSATHVGQATSS